LILFDLFAQKDGIDIYNAARDALEINLAKDAAELFHRERHITPQEQNKAPVHTENSPRQVRLYFTQTPNECESVSPVPFQTNKCEHYNYNRARALYKARRQKNNSQDEKKSVVKPTRDRTPPTSIQAAWHHLKAALAT